jgi:uncharacterized membrane protein
MSIAISLHLLAAMIWVGGMFFAYMALRPVAASLLQPPLRLPLWDQTFARFFPWVWAAILVLPLTGYWMILGVFGGFAQVGIHVHVMQTLGWIMIGIFLYVFFVPYRGLQRSVAASDFPTAGLHLARIRRMIGVNLVLGLITAAVAAGGIYFPR